jgi:hypothetical protein
LFFAGEIPRDMRAMATAFSLLAIFFQSSVAAASLVWR